MKLKHFLAGITLAACTFISTSCSDDDYSPITLISISEQAPSINEETNTLTFNPFNEGVSFHISGGDGGRYIIRNSNQEVVDFDYDGETLIIKPSTLGEATIAIHDNSGNSYTLKIIVEYTLVSFQTTSITTDIEAPNMTQASIRQLEEQIIADSPVAVESIFTFTYTNKEQTEGSVTIAPNRAGQSSNGIFTQELKYTQDTGTSYIEYAITLAGNENHVMMLMPQTDITRESPLVPMSMVEDVTATYQTTYPDLESARLIFTVITQP